MKKKTLEITFRSTSKNPTFLIGVEENYYFRENKCEQPTVR